MNTSHNRNHLFTLPTPQLVQQIYLKQLNNGKILQLAISIKHHDNAVTTDKRGGVNSVTLTWAISSVIIMQRKKFKLTIFLESIVTEASIKYQS